MIVITYLIVWILIIYNSFTKLLYNHKLAEYSGLNIVIYPYGQVLKFGPENFRTF